MTRHQLHFAHANSYPAGTYKQFFAHLGKHFDIQALEMHAHNPAYPVEDGWRNLVQELVDELERRYTEPVILAGHSLGGMLSMMTAKARPDLVRCVLMLDSPVVAGWRAFMLKMAKRQGWAEPFSPARFSKARRNVWPSAQAAYDHFIAKDIFAAWAPGVLADYIEHGLKPHADGVQLRFTRENETAVYRSLPHHLGRLVRDGYPVPIGFVGGTESAECRQAGLDATRRLVGPFFRQLQGGHLFPMESPTLAAEAAREMIARLLEEGTRAGELPR